jgi:hypothetical protein
MPDNPMPSTILLAAGCSFRSTGYGPVQECELLALASDDGRAGVQ